MDGVERTAHHPKPVSLVGIRCPGCERVPWPAVEATLTVRATLADRPGDGQQQQQQNKCQQAEAPGRNRQFAVHLGLQQRQSQRHRRSLADHGRNLGENVAAGGEDHRCPVKGGIVLDPVRRTAARTIKPRVSKQTWATLRRLDPRKPSMTRLAAEFGTDKLGLHRYPQHYQRHFAALRRSEFSLLEIGIGGYSRERAGGRSLRMWKAFFPKAQIIGLDIEDKSFVNEDRILAYQGSQTDAALLKQIFRTHGKFKIIVDDGSHRPDHIRTTSRSCSRCWPRAACTPSRTPRRPTGPGSVAAPTSMTRPPPWRWSRTCSTGSTTRSSAL